MGVALARGSGGAAGGSRGRAVADLTGDGGQHHAVGDVGVGAVVGLDPQHAAFWVEPRAVGAKSLTSG